MDKFALKCFVAILALGMVCTLADHVLAPKDASASSTDRVRDVYSQALSANNQTCGDNDAGSANSCSVTLNMSGTLLLNCADANGCTMSFVEPPASESGRTWRIINVGTGTATFAESAGVFEGAGSFAMGQWDALSVVYAGDRWVETGRSNN